MRNYILDRVEMLTESGCWIWMKATDGKGYGNIQIKETRKHTKAHRAAWIAFNGEIPKGMEICHKCDVKSCCNPNHLFVGTHKENMADMASKGRARNRFGKSSCLNGHEYSPENTGFDRGIRYCRICSRNRAARYYERKKSGALDVF